MFQMRSNGGNNVTMHTLWKELYQAALVEVQPEELRRRLAAAEKAICQRVEELRQTDTGSGEELRAINDALRALRALAQSEGQPPPSLLAGPPRRGVAS
jgi:hypothetical protein